MDFEVFENALGFGGLVFSELAFVEVSSNGIDFARMPAVSCIDRPLGAFDGIASEETYNLAGNFTGGTGFDLTGVVVMNPPGAVSVEQRSFGAVKSLYDSR